MPQDTPSPPAQDADIWLFLADEGQSTRMAQIFARHLGAGDTVLLSGPVGAGKSHFARAFIRAMIGENTEVPSPSFTLVQTYNADGFDIWHADLYRLADAGEVAELGLDEAMGQDLCLIEWPDRLPQMPRGAMSLTLAYDGEGRRAQITGAGGALRAALLAGFAP